MKILFVSANLFYTEPLGLMMLSSIAKRQGHTTALLVLQSDNIIKKLSSFKPDLIAYSTMSADLNSFLHADLIISQWATKNNQKLIRIMGGPHATFFPEIKNELMLDAICIGEGDLVFQRILTKASEQKTIQSIPNVIGYNENINQIQKELISDLDQFPYADRNIYYNARPIYRHFRLRSFLTARGRPFHCTYCHNATYNKMFAECGAIIRKHSVDYMIEEIKHTIKKHPPVRMVRFADDTFAYKIDNWLIQFLEKYKKEINLPFYCLMRSNTLTEEMAKLLSKAGCCSIGMSLESGVESVRNNVLKRNLPDPVVIKSFEYAQKYGISAHGNAMSALPAGTLMHDLTTYTFSRNLKMGLSSFGIFMPYPKTELTDYAIKLGQLDPQKIANRSFTRDKSPLNSYTEKEKNVQLNIMYLGSIFANLPDLFQPLFFRLIKLPPNLFYKIIGRSYVLYKFYRNIFPGVIPKNPLLLIPFYLKAMKYLLYQKNKKIQVGHAKNSNPIENQKIVYEN